MGKRKGDQPPPQVQDVAGSEPAKTTMPSDASVARATEPVKIEAPEFVPAAPSIAAEQADAVTPPPAAPPVVATGTPKIEATESAPPVDAPKPIVLYRMTARDEASATEDVATADTATAETARLWPKMRRLTPLAASIAIAAAIGAMAGSATTAGLGGLWAQPAAPAKTADMRPLRDTITRLNTELAALKSSIDNSGRVSNAQFSKLGDRLDRVERGQAEPAAKLAKLTDAVDRIEHRVPAATSTANDITGSIAAPATRPAAASPARPAGPPVLDGWFVRSVYHGAALIQTRYGGVLEVEPGDNLPGLGRVENIHRQDGRWVVVTSRGMIVAR
jgi:hypothetical protein